MNTHTKTRVSPGLLIKIYHQVKSNPLKTYLKKDFSRNAKYVGRALRLLVKLDVLEQVPAIYKSGRKYKIVRNVKGYRLKGWRK